MYWYDSPCAPVFQRHGIGIAGADEDESIPEVVEAGFVCSNCIQEVTHRWVVGAVADENEMIQTGGIVDQVRNNAPSQIKLPKILVRKD